MDNAGEFTTQALNDYCISLRIDVEHSVSHVHNQNGLVVTKLHVRIPTKT